MWLNGVLNVQKCWVQIDGAYIMAIQHYEGQYYDGQYKGLLVKFDYDDTEFVFGEDTGVLFYIGDEKDGSKIHIPEGTVDCSRMFWGRGSLLKTAPVIPESVKICDRMFSGCTFLKQPPVLPNGIEHCFNMFRGCKSLERAPIIPDTVTDCREMFDGCSEEIQKAGEWNIEHRGFSYYDDRNTYDDHIRKRKEKLGEYFSGIDFDDSLRATLYLLINKYEESDKNIVYKSVIDTFMKDCTVSVNKLQQNIKMADKMYMLRKNRKEAAGICKMPEEDDMREDVSIEDNDEEQRMLEE